MSNVLVPGAPGPEQQDAPLSEQERKLLVRLFSDPTYFPVEFRTWIKTYLESSDIRLPSSAIVGGNAPKVNLPAGVIMPFAGGNIPSNCKLCNGESLLRTEWDLLFQAIGTIWGAIDGTHFNIPDLQDRTLYGAGNVIGLAATDGRAAGSRGGPFHHHSVGIASDAAGDHSHGVSVDVSVGVSVSGSTGGAGGHDHAPGGGGGFVKGTGQMGAGAGSAYYVGGNWTSGTDSEGDHSHSVSASGGGSGSGSGGTDNQGNHQHWVAGDTSGGYDDKPAYAGIHWIIATGKNV